MELLDEVWKWKMKRWRRCDHDSRRTRLYSLTSAPAHATSINK
jgi:hypothetical protein